MMKRSFSQLALFIFCLLAMFAPTQVSFKPNDVYLFQEVKSTSKSGKFSDVMITGCRKLGPGWKPLFVKKQILNEHMYNLCMYFETDVMIHFIAVMMQQPFTLDNLNQWSVN